MTNIDKSQAILEVLKKHPPITRKEIHDNLPPGTYDDTYSLKDCLDNISQRLLALEKKGLAARAGTNDDGIILWTVPAAAPEAKPAEPERNPPEREAAPSNLTAEIMRNNPPPSPGIDFSEGTPEDSIPDAAMELSEIETVGWVERSETHQSDTEQSGETVGDLAMAEFDAALATIRTTVRKAIALNQAPKIRNKAATLDALYDVTLALQKIAPTHYRLLLDLGAILLEMDETQP